MFSRSTEPRRTFGVLAESRAPAAHFRKSVGRIRPKCRSARGTYLRITRPPAPRIRIFVTVRAGPDSLLSCQSQGGDQARQTVSFDRSRAGAMHVAAEA